MQESNKVANAGLKTKPQPGTKIRCINDGGWYFLTKGKIYEVLRKINDEKLLTDLKEKSIVWNIEDYYDYMDESLVWKIERELEKTFDVTKEK